MIKDYLKITWRTLYRQWQFSLISITGLAIGLACCILIVIYVRHEYSYDRYHANADRIYRVARISINSDGQEEPTAGTVRAIAVTLDRELHEVRTATTFRPTRQMAMVYGDKRFIETKIFEADSSLFKVFSFPFLKGNPRDALRTENSIVITETTARRYFGDDEPLGEMIRGERGDFFVTGVVKDISSNTHFHFDMLIPLQTVEIAHNTEWLGSQNYLTYVKLNEMADASAFEAKVNAMAKARKPDSRDEYFIQPLTSIHLHSGLKNELEANGNSTAIQTLVIIATLVMAIAAINYVNLATARASRRAKEVGVRKTSGALRRTLMFQFLTESVVSTLIAFALAVCIVMLFMHPFKQLAGVDLSLFQRELSSFWIVLFIVVAGLGAIAGIYPALLLSSFNPIRALKGGVPLGSPSSGWLRKVLVGFQFTISICLIIAMIVIVRQVKYITEKDAGFDRDQVIIVSSADRLKNRDVLENGIKQLAGVEYVGATTTLIGSANWSGNIRINRDGTDRRIDFCQVNYEYLDAMGIRLLEGRNFSKEFPADTINTIILNETAVRELNLNKPIGQRLVWNEGGPDTVLYAEVVGVVRDFHYASFHEPIRPFAFLIRNNFFVQEDFTGNLLVRVNRGNAMDVVRQTEELWRDLVPHRPFTFRFMDDHFLQIHAAEIRFKSLFSWLTGMAIFISCLGLFGLIAFMVSQRTREIAIRKVLGASLSSILLLLNRELAQIVAIALLIASPIALYLTNQWLATFAYHVEVEWWTFAVAGIATLFVLFIATGYQSVKAGLANPVDSLKAE